MEPHTAAKHAILQGYLFAWLPIMAKFHGRLIYVDGFAGPGVYENGEPGSPIIAINAYLEHEQRAKIDDTELVYVFIEEDAERVTRLRAEVDKLDLPKNVKVYIEQGAFEEKFGEVLDQVEDSGGNLAPTFAFVDPFGYSFASMNLSGRFLQFQRCEVLIYVPLRHLNRFLSLENQEEALNSLFGTEDWKAARDMDSGTRLRFLRDLFYGQLKSECGLKYVRSFEIISTTNPAAGYTLFFGTNHKLGLQRMKEAMWSIDRVEGQRFKDTTSDALQPLFDPEVDTTPLKTALVEHFGSKPFTIEEALDFTLVDTPYIPSHVKTRALKPLEEADKLEALTPRKRRGTYPAGTKLRFKQ